MKQINIKKESYELFPRYDSRQSFYRKAYVTELQYNDCVVYVLKSYDTIVAVVTDNKETKWAYVNQKISKDLLYSNTTLRHIKEFFKQYYKYKDYKKSDLMKYESIVDYVEILESDDISLSMCGYGNIANATSPQQKKWFKNAFENYREKVERFCNGDTYLITSYKYGFSNHYYINLESRV